MHNYYRINVKINFYSELKQLSNRLIHVLLTYIILRHCQGSSTLGVQVGVMTLFGRLFLWEPGGQTFMRQCKNLVLKTSI